MNMSYCMFQNTSNDLNDCVGELQYADDLNHLDLSKEENQAMRRMYVLCHEYIDEYNRLYNLNDEDEQDGRY